MASVRTNCMSPYPFFQWPCLRGGATSNIPSAFSNRYLPPQKRSLKIQRRTRVNRHPVYRHPDAEDSDDSDDIDPPFPRRCGYNPYNKTESPAKCWDRCSKGDNDEEDAHECDKLESCCPYRALRQNNIEGQPTGGAQRHGGLLFSPRTQGPSFPIPDALKIGLRNPRARFLRDRPASPFSHPPSPSPPPTTPLPTSNPLPTLPLSLPTGGSPIIIPKRSESVASSTLSLCNDMWSDDEANESDESVEDCSLG